MAISCFRSGVPGQSKPEASSKAKTELPCEELRFGKEEGDNGYEAFAAPAEAECSWLLLTWCRWPDSNGYGLAARGF